MRVAFLDSGVSEKYIKKCENIYSVLRDSGTDEFGHGSFVFETISRMASSNVKIDSVKVLDEKGRGDIGSILKGLAICIDQRYEIICMSLALTKRIDRVDENRLKALLKEMKRKNQFVFCSARNKFYDWTSIPASYSEVYGVFGGITGNERKYYYDKRRRVQIFASGEPIVVRDLEGHRGIFKGNSKATALMCGLIAGLATPKSETENALCKNAYAKMWSKTEFLNSLEGRKTIISNYQESNGSLIATMVDEANRQNEYFYGNKAEDREKHAFRIISYIEEKLDIDFKDESIIYEDMVNDETLIYAMENKWERKNKREKKS